MAVKGSKQLEVPSFLYRQNVQSSFGWLVAQYGSRSPDRLTTIQMRNICDSQIVPQACRNTLKHTVAGLDWHLADAPEGGKDIRGTVEGDHYYAVLENPLDAAGNTITFPDWVDLGTDDILTAREGGCSEIVRDKKGVPQHILTIDGATVRFTGDSRKPVYQVSPWGEVGEAWEADRFFQARWHPNPRMGAELTNRAPVQLAYTGIAILASSDTYNFKLITEPVPAGALNLGPGFTRDEATAWKASWDRGMVGINPEPLALLYGTQNVQYISFRPPLKDMAFETSFHWYASLVAACFEISILDISILTRVSTRAAAEQQSEATKRQGLRHLMRKWKQAIERHILPEGVFFIWEDIDPTDEKVEAEIAEAIVSRLAAAKGAGFITAEQGFLEMKRLKCLDEELQFEAGEEGMGGEETSDVQALVDEFDEGGTLVEALDTGGDGGDEEELAQYLQKGQDEIVRLVSEQAAEALTANPLEGDDPYWEVDPAYLEELQARVDLGRDAGGEEATE